MQASKLEDKAYITKRINGEHSVTVDKQVVIMNSLTAKKFLTEISTRSYLGAYRVSLPDKSAFNLLKLQEDDYGAYVTFYTDNNVIIGAVKNLIPKANFNIFGLGNLSITYGKTYDRLLKKKFMAWILRTFLNGVVSKKRIISLAMTYNI